MKIEKQNAYLSIAAFLHMLILGFAGTAFTEFPKNKRSDLVLFLSTAAFCVFLLVLIWVYLKFFKTDKKKK